MASAEEGEVALPAAHLAAHGGQYVVYVPSAQLEAQAAAAQALQTALLPCGQTCSHETRLVLGSTLTRENFQHCPQSV